MEYCSVVWGTASPSQLELISNIENKASKIIGETFNPGYDITTRRKVGGLAFLRRMMSGETSTELQQLLPPPRQQRRANLRSSIQGHPRQLEIPLCRTEDYKRSFVPSYTTVWSNLPPDIAQLETSHTVFKRHLCKYFCT